MAGIVNEREWENIYRRIQKGEYGLDGILQSTHELNKDGLNIIAVIHDKATACEEYRVIQPLQELEKVGHNCFIMNAGYMMKRVEQRIDDFLGADLVLFNRMADSDEVKIVEIARKHGAAVVCDYDDDMTNLYRRVHDKVLPDLGIFDAVTVSTDWLKHLYAGSNKHIYVLPNTIQRRRFEGWERDIPQPTIGLTGSKTHAEDWQVVVQPLIRILERHAGWRVFVSGYMPPELEHHQKVYTPAIVKPEWAIEGLKVPYAKYGWLMANIDILLIPVDPTDKFNWSKSSLKYREGATAACACIATGRPLPCYLDDITRPEIGMLVQHNEQEWEMSIEFLIDRPETRRNMGVHAAMNSEKYAAELAVDERLQVYRTIIERKKRRQARTQPTYH